jgi:class 3 adenylate cyclase
MSSIVDDDEIAERILHDESARGERVVAWGRGALWVFIAAILVVGLSGLEPGLGRGLTVVLGLAFGAGGVASLLYASWLTPARWRPSFGWATSGLDIAALSLLPILLAGRSEDLIAGELVGGSPNLLFQIFGLVAVHLRRDTRVTVIATVWVVGLCLFAAVYATGHPLPRAFPEGLRFMIPQLWCVRALIVGLMGLVLAVSARNARGMVRRASSAMAERSHVMRVFGRYVAPEIRDAVVGGERPAELREVTVLFTDLRDYTSLSERIDPTELIALLNRHFAVLVPIVHEHGGTVNKFVGDALMATFGAPARLEQHAAAAVRAAIQMTEAMARLATELRAEGKPELRMGIGIATGPVVVGNLGDPARSEYAVLGDTVNLAARLEGLNKERDTQILVSERTAATSALPLTELPKAKVKGKQAELRVFSP